MYKVTCDGVVMHNPISDTKLVMNGKVSNGVNSFGSFTFDIYPDNPCYGSLTELSSLVKVYRDDTLIFAGRVLDEDIGIDEVRTVTCEGILALMRDTVQPPFYFDGTPRALLERFVEAHNSMADGAGSRQLATFEVGTVSGFGDDAIVRSSEGYNTTWDLIKDKLTGSALGGYLDVVYMGDDGNGIDLYRINYYAESPYASTQNVRLRKNILDIARNVTADGFYTALCVHGKELEAQDGEDETAVKAYLDLNSCQSGDVGDGQRVIHGDTAFIVDTEMVDRYGMIMGVTEHNDVTTPGYLLECAKSDLANAVSFTAATQIKFVDLSFVDSSEQRVACGDYVWVESEKTGLKTYLLVTSLDENLDSPDDNTITVESDRATMTSERGSKVSRGSGLGLTETGSVALSTNSQFSTDAAGRLALAKNYQAATAPVKSTSDDTVEKWSEFGSGYTFISENDVLQNQPKQWGLLANATNGGSEVHQLWMGQPFDDLLHRAGNAKGWNQGNAWAWRRILDTNNLFKVVSLSSSITIAANNNASKTWTAVAPAGYSPVAITKIKHAHQTAWKVAEFEANSSANTAYIALSSQGNTSAITGTVNIDVLCLRTS